MNANVVDKIRKKHGAHGTVNIHTQTYIIIVSLTDISQSDTTYYNVLETLDPKRVFEMCLYYYW
jgi:hypothetical protein